MSEELNKLVIESVPNQEKANQLLGKLFDVTQPDVVYSKPQTIGEYTVITASEVTASFGTGYGGGGGFGPGDEETGQPSGYGGGGGGGGTTLARPVAAISIGPNGVEVKPIVDPTKFGIAIATAVGAMFMALGRMRHFRDSGEM
ncbi:MAG: hypothetical protein H6667_22920 [Ardenticatenaceae bacterium]|nr:hypothetical protein [Ardenticatenaceae bacterium]